MSNPFDLLGNDVEDATIVAPLPPKEIVKHTTSSKKSDVPPPSADPSRANKNRPKPTGNEAALKDRNGGRKNNKARDAPAETTDAKKTSHAARRATDRQSRSGKVDTDKKVRQGWGDNKKEVSDEAAAEADAAAEIEADKATEETPVSNKKSLQDYLNENNSSEFNKAPSAKKVDQLENAELLVKKEEVYAEPTKVKNLKSKQLKSKQYLDFDVSFADDQSAAKPRKFDNNKGGPKRGGKPKASKNAGEQKPAVNAKNFPSLA
ncbi:LANO_0H05666g1_1 [Lachancea nothofagi CBS 11611]|uniref:LANO_0H05666g1_1 n=1 Tax=Lachancea nothofagi CBS 11611 TaxID=1266666 RepID=A0A1G4KLB6_9SACH|nr:LANO_0H05666g1_1 [Lachancea nothofagi CBS 11611]